MKIRVSSKKSETITRNSMYLSSRCQNLVAHGHWDEQHVLPRIASVGGHWLEQCCVEKMLKLV